MFPLLLATILICLFPIKILKKILPLMRGAHSFLLLKCPLQLGRKGLAALKFISRFKPRQLLPICLVINFDSTNAKNIENRPMVSIWSSGFTSQFYVITVTRFHWHIVEHFEWILRGQLAVGCHKTSNHSFAVALVFGSFNWPVSAVGHVFSCPALQLKWHFVIVLAIITPQITQPWRLCT